MKAGKIAVRLVTLTYLILFCQSTMLAQSNIPLGTWRTHFQYQDVRQLILANNRVYAVTANTLFYIDQSDNSINKLTQIDGLSEVGISALFYSQELQTLIIGYQNGTIDFLRDNEIVEFDAIALSAQLQVKRITSLAVKNNICYAGTSIGVVAIDISRMEILESYTEIGPDASRVLVNDMAIVDSDIILATDIGLMKASLENNFNLLDFNNWDVLVPPISFPFLSQLAVDDGRIFTGHFDNLLSFENDNWTDHASLIEGYSLLDLDDQGALKITIGNNLGSRILSNEFEELYATSQLLRSSSGTVNRLLLATSDAGMIELSGGQATTIALEGPPTDQLDPIIVFGEDVYAIPKARSILRRINLTNGAFGLFSEGSWSTTGVPGFDNITDIAQVNGKVYLSSAGDGLLDFTSSIYFNRSNQNHPLEPESITDSLIVIPAIASGVDNDLWVLNDDTDRALHRLTADANWESYSLGFGQGARFPEKVEVSQRTGIVWISSDPQVGGLYLHDPNENISLNLSNTTGLPSSRINDLVIGREDEVWVATNRGVAFFQSSESPFFDGFADAIVPIIDGALLLDNEIINSIAVDGGNRKWIGTNDGVWIVGSSGDEIVERYTTSNSPIPSDSILNIGINDVSGEVFIATTRGLVSFRSNATAAENQFSAVKVFPNPVPPNYQGLIGISGLVEDVNVKITDLSGHLVKEFFANGGSVSWDGKDLNGQHVGSGIYLVFSGNRDGSETFVGKFAVVR